MALSDFLKSFTLSAPVGNNMTSRDEDVRTVIGALERLDYFDRDSRERDYEDKPLGLITARLDEKIKTFQKDNDLKIDGILRPGGETIKTLGVRVAEKNAAPARTPPFAPVSASRSTSTSQSAPPPAETSPPPDYRREVFKGSRAKEWDDFHKLNQDDPSLSDNERAIMRNIYAAEGGMKKNPGSSAYAGILQDTLDGNLAKGTIPGVKMRHAGKKSLKPEDLSMQDVQEVYKVYFDDVTSSARIGYARRNKGESKTGLQLLGDLDNGVGTAVADTLFKNGGSDGAVIIQTAINEHLPENQKIGIGKSVGSETYIALEKAAADKISAKIFLVNLNRARKKKEKDSDRETPRIDYYLPKD